MDIWDEWIEQYIAHKRRTGTPLSEMMGEWLQQIDSTRLSQYLRAGAKEAEHMENELSILKARIRGDFKFYGDEVSAPPHPRSSSWPGDWWLGGRV